MDVDNARPLQKFTNDHRKECGKANKQGKEYSQHVAPVLPFLHHELNVIFGDYNRGYNDHRKRKPCEILCAGSYAAQNSA